MVSVMVLEVLLQASVLCILLRTIARYEADYSFRKLAMVAAGIALGNMAIQALLQEHVPLSLRPLLIIPCIAFTAFMIMTFCWIDIWKSLLVVVIFVGIQLASQLGIALIVERFGPNAEQRAAEIEKKQQDVVEVQKAILDMMDGPPRANPSIPPATPPAASPMPQPELPKPAAVRPAVVRKPATEKPAAKPPSKGVDEWAEAEKMLKVAGILHKGDKHLAMVNNAVVAENETVTVRHNGKIYRWRASEISKSDVTWARME